METIWIIAIAIFLLIGFLYQRFLNGYVKEKFGENTFGKITLLDSFIQHSFGKWSCEFKFSDCDYPDGLNYYYDDFEFYFPSCAMIFRKGPHVQRASRRNCFAGIKYSLF